MDAMLQNNVDYNTWVSQKQSRIAQVRFEIALETARDTIDPNALGVRYAEIEGICRQMRDKAAELRTNNLSLLTDAQKTRLKVLDDAMQLAPLVSQAQSVSLLDGNAGGSFSFSGSGGFASILLGTPVPGGCTSAVPTGIIRTGDFAARP